MRGFGANPISPRLCKYVVNSLLNLFNKNGTLCFVSFLSVCISVLLMIERIQRTSSGCDVRYPPNTNEGRSESYER